VSTKAPQGAGHEQGRGSVAAMTLGNRDGKQFGAAGAQTRDGISREAALPGGDQEQAGTAIEQDAKKTFVPGVGAEGLALDGENGGEVGRAGKADIEIDPGFTHPVSIVSDEREQMRRDAFHRHLSHVLLRNLFRNLALSVALLMGAANCEIPKQANAKNARDSAAQVECERRPRIQAPLRAIKKAHNAFVNLAIRLSAIGTQQPDDSFDEPAAKPDCNAPRIIEAKSLPAKP